jgi:hypothetical protein
MINVDVTVNFEDGRELELTGGKVEHLDNIGAEVTRLIEQSPDIEDEETFTSLVIVAVAISPPKAAS